MEISIPVEAELVSSSLKDETTPYNFNIKQNFTHNSKFQDNDKIYQWVKESLIPPDYKHGDENGYKANDIIFKDNKVTIVKSVGEKYIPQQPENYASGFDNTFTLGTWTKYFSKIQTGLTPATFTGFTKEVNGIKHRLYHDPKSSTNWYYEITFDVTKVEWGTELFDTNSSDGKVTMVRYTNKPKMDLMYNGLTSLKAGITAQPVQYKTEYTVGADKYRVGGLERTGSTTKAGSEEHSKAGIFVVPEGITSIHVCMIGGGGAGGSCEDINAHTIAGGGKAGAIQSFDLAVSAGDRIPFSVGTSGTGIKHGAGKAGGNTQFGTTVAAGGVGGLVSSSAYAGNGASKTNCYGTFKDGTSRSSGGSTMYGGEAGFANGANAFARAYKGAGGGGSQSPYAAGGTGGTGHIKISWLAEGGTTVYYYGVQKEITKNEINREFEEANFYTALNEDSIIQPAICFNGTDCNNSWLGKTFVMRGTDLYVRTSTGLAELEHVLSPEYAVASTLDMLQSSGFVYLSPTEPHKPLDDKAYTAATTTGGTLTMTIIADGRFNTLALGSLIADSVDVLFKDAAGNQVAEINDYAPHNNRDINYRLPDYQTTIALYSWDDAQGKVIDIEKGGTVTITLKGASISLGMAMLGLSVDAGFTNIAFQNEFLDLSPMEKDQWHNIVYKAGLKVSIHSGRVDMPITHYDMMNRLMISIGGSKVILNGSSSLDNTPADSKCVFGATMLIGRMENIKLATKLEDKEIGDMATYTFKIIEDV